ncbi:MAG: hypothetical protein QW051_01305 [Candidatus Aenigmatarchaeota archaeon]
MKKLITSFIGFVLALILDVLFPQIDFWGLDVTSTSFWYGVIIYIILPIFGFFIGIFLEKLENL